MRFCFSRFCRPPLHGSSGEKLILFTGNSGSQVDIRFRETTLPEITKVAEALGVELQVEAKKRGLPMVQFRFPAPLDNYTGEAGTITGVVTFPSDLKFSGMKGSVAADTSSVTMGEEDLDATILGDLFLDATTYPVSEFIIEEVNGKYDSLEFGRLATIHIKGRFRLKGKEPPLAFPADIEPGIGENNRPRLFITCALTIDLKTFNIEGAQGPEPERHTLLFDINITMQGANGKE